jgi:hypothetical protein
LGGKTPNSLRKFPVIEFPDLEKVKMQLYGFEDKTLAIITPDQGQPNLRYPLPLYLIKENWLIP